MLHPSHLAQPLQHLGDIHDLLLEVVQPPLCQQAVHHHVQVAARVVLADVGQGGQVKLVVEPAAMAVKQAGPDDLQGQADAGAEGRGRGRRYEFRESKSTPDL